MQVKAGAGLVFAIMLVVAGSAGAAADDPGPDKAAIAATAAGAAGADAGPSAGSHTTVTLVTGDTVDVVTDSSGRLSATPGAAEGEPSAGYLHRVVDGDQFIIPFSAVPALESGRLDEELFNISGLVRQRYDDAHTDQIPLIATFEPGISARWRRSPPPAPSGVEFSSRSMRSHSPPTRPP